MKRNSVGLAAAIGKKQLTPDGVNWLTLALDPFHDLNVPVAGYPDADCSNTVVQCFQYQVDFATPNAAWDMHVYVNQSISQSGEYEYKAANNNVAQLSAQTPGNKQGILKITTCATGELLAPTKTVAYAPGSGQHSSMGNYTDLLNANSRIIGLGFEIINTSAEIYKQGSITCYKMPQTMGLSNCVYENAAGTGFGNSPVNLLKEAPSSVAIASNLHGTVAWEAAKGAYIVCTQQSTNNDLSGLTWIPTLRCADGTFPANDYMHGDQVNFTAAADPTRVNTLYAIKNFPFNTHGAMLTGLNANSTIRVRLRVYVERAPSISSADTSLVVLATPSAPYDANALRIYSEVASKMPVAVPVSMNSMGDWWRVISGIAKSVALPIGQLLGGPKGQAIGGIAAAGLGALDQVFPSEPTTRGAGPVPEGANPSRASVDTIVTAATGIRPSQAKPRRATRRRGEKPRRQKKGGQPDYSKAFARAMKNIKP